jgi:hypothetical protein
MTSAAWQAILFLHRRILEIELPWRDDVVQGTAIGYLINALSIIITQAMGKQPSN